MSNKGEREGERLLMINTYKCVPKSRVGKTGLVCRIRVDPIDLPTHLS